MRIIIIANGEPPTRADLNQWLRPNATLICADGGARAALRFGLRPHHAIGDFDSVGEGELQQLEKLGTQLHRHPAAKNETDLELALMFAAQLSQADATREIIVLGAMGGRIDHQLANMMLLAMPMLQGCRVVMAHRPDEIMLVDARRSPTEITSARPGRRCGFAHPVWGRCTRPSHRRVAVCAARRTAAVWPSAWRE